MHFSNKEYVLKNKKGGKNEGIYTITSTHKAEVANAGLDNSAENENGVEKTKDKRYFKIDTRYKKCARNYTHHRELIKNLLKEKIRLQSSTIVLISSSDNEKEGAGKNEF